MMILIMLLIAAFTAFVVEDAHGDGHKKEAIFWIVLGVGSIIMTYFMFR